MSHTPGTWTVSELDATGEVSEYHIFIEPGVAVIERKVAGQNQHDMADALLIAAAKELMAALNAVMADINDAAVNGVTSPLHIETRNKVRAAIAKATGATP